MIKMIEYIAISPITPEMPEVIVESDTMNKSDKKQKDKKHKFSKGDFVLKNLFQTFVLKISDIQK